MTRPRKSASLGRAARVPVAVAVGAARRYPPATRGVVVVWGLLARVPFGGLTWQTLHHVDALRRLGFDVWYVEDSDSFPYDPATLCQTFDGTANLAYLSEQMAAIGLDDRWIFRAPATEEYYGASRQVLFELYERADAVLNVCAAQEIRPEHERIRRLVYLETDPVAVQLAVASGDAAAIRQLDAHHHHYTYGHNLGAADCPVPVERYEWIPTRPPVCIDWWSTGSIEPRETFTTVMTWRHTGRDVEWNGQKWRWRKDVAVERLADLPRRSPLPLELAVAGIDDAGRAVLERRGWIVAPPVLEAHAYREYVRSSFGEFTVAKEQVVRSRSGWFSDRSACYLAAGRPVITEATGFENLLPVGEGLFAFTSEDEAVAAIEDVASDYPRHSRAAREIAREFFAAERVLGDILRRIGLL
jgi:glycosyltransferase involved in cell wall biosynthesis